MSGVIETEGIGEQAKKCSVAGSRRLAAESLNLSVKPNLDQTLSRRQ
jgi:hypothetical protein